MSDRQYYLRIRGKIMGPFGMDQLRSLRDRGQFRAFHEVSQDRQAWVPATKLEELFPSAPPAPSSDSRAITVQPGLMPTAPGMNGEWFYVDSNATRQGPISERQLLALRAGGSIDDESLVWKDGLPEWRPFGKADLRIVAPDVTLGAASSGENRKNTGRLALDGRDIVVGWRKVRTGILLELIAIFISIGVVILASPGLLIAASSGAEAGAKAVLLTYLCYVGTGFVTQVVKIVGYCFCLGTPAANGSRGLATATLVTAICYLLMAIANLVLPFIGVLNLVGRGFGDVLVSFSVLSWLMVVTPLFLLTLKEVLFMLYLRSLTLALGATALTGSLTGLLYLYGTAILVLLLTGALAFGLLVDGIKGVFAVCGVAGIIYLLISLVWLVWYILILFQVRSLIAARPLDPGAAEKMG